MTEPFMHDPIRLIDSAAHGRMVEADLGLRHDLELAAAARVDYPVDAGLARFEATLAGASTLPAGGTVAGFAVLRWFLGASVLLGIGVIAWLGLTSEPEAEPRARAPAVALAEPQAPAELRSEDEVVAEIDSTNHVVGSDTSSVAGIDARGSVAETQQPDGNGEIGALVRSDGGEPAGRIAVSPRPTSKSVPDEPSLATEPLDEAKLIDAARKALAEDPALALELTEQAADRFPTGAMVQERRGYAILALLALDRRDEAEQQAGEYLERWPKGPLSRRIREGLGLLP
jgi:hypothetical protein